MCNVRFLACFVVVASACGEVKSGGSDSVDAPPGGEMVDAPGAVEPVDAGPDAGPDALTACSMPNTTTCTDGVLEVCGPDGTVTSGERCALGCATDAPRCQQVAPSNGLAPYVDQAAGLEAVTIPAGSTIDTGSGTIRDASGGTVEVSTVVIAQPGAPELRIYMAKAFTISNARITGSRAVAFVSSGPVDIVGVVDASGDLGVSGPGGDYNSAGRGGVATTPGHWERQRAGDPPGCRAGYNWVTYGGGGGSYGSSGASGGGTGPGAPGAVSGTATITPLVGGYRGGADVPARAGGGGGAVQIVSGARIAFLSVPGSVGVVQVGGGGGAGGNSTCPSEAGGGEAAAGGGSGGAILIEAPVVSIEAEGAGVVASGGAGGSGCTVGNGQDAPSTGATAVANECPAESHGSVGGAGAAAVDAVRGGDQRAMDGGGGGGLGRVRINTVDGTYQAAAGAVVRGAVTTGTVAAR